MNLVVVVVRSTVVVCWCQMIIRVVRDVVMMRVVVEVVIVVS